MRYPVRFCTAATQKVHSRVLAFGYRLRTANLVIKRCTFETGVEARYDALRPDGFRTCLICRPARSNLRLCFERRTAFVRAGYETAKERFRLRPTLMLGGATRTGIPAVPCCSMFKSAGVPARPTWRQCSTRGHETRDARDLINRVRPHPRPKPTARYLGLMFCQPVVRGLNPLGEFQRFMPAPPMFEIHEPVRRCRMPEFNAPAPARRRRVRSVTHFIPSVLFRNEFAIPIPEWHPHATTCPSTRIFQGALC